MAAFFFRTIQLEYLYVTTEKGESLIELDFWSTSS